MKKTLLIILTLHLSSFCLFAQETANKELLDQFNKKNLEVVSLYKSQDFKKAQSVATEALELAKKVYGENDTETAVSFKNLGEVLRMRKKYKEAVDNFDMALAIYQAETNQNVLKILPLLESKGTVLAFDKKKKEAELIFDEHLLFAEETFGKESDELLPYLKIQTDFYLYLKNFDRADEMFIRRQVIQGKVNGDIRVDNLSDETVCYLHNYLRSDQVFSRQRKISEAVSLALGRKSFKKLSQTEDIKRISGGVVNGKAKRLPKPDYPPAAKSARIGGKVLVKILIGNDGKILEAKAICGHFLLRQAAEDAAKIAVFTPTNLFGKKVEVSGMIIYNFQ